MQYPYPRPAHFDTVVLTIAYWKPTTVIFVLITVAGNDLRVGLDSLTLTLNIIIIYGHATGLLAIVSVALELGHGKT